MTTFSHNSADGNKTQPGPHSKYDCTFQEVLDNIHYVFDSTVYPGFWADWRLLNTIDVDRLNDRHDPVCPYHDALTLQDVFPDGQGDKRLEVDVGRDSLISQKALHLSNPIAVSSGDDTWTAASLSVDPSGNADFAGEQNR